MADLTKMTDKQLKSQHTQVLKRLEAARKAGNGQRLWAARLAADEVQAEVNKRFGAPPSQMIGG